MKTFREILKGTELYSRISVITDEAKNSLLRDLGKNDFIHSKNIESILDRLIPDFIKTDEKYFDKGEIFLLLVLIYYHDIGRKTDLFYHEIESYKKIREYPNLLGLSEFEADAVSQICAAHADEKDWPIDRNDDNFGIAGLTSSGRTFNLQKLGALLRLGDELDNTYLRTKGITDQEGSIRKIIRDINPKYEYSIIEIQASPKNWRDYELLVKVRDYTQKRLREIEKYLREINLNYYQVWLDPEDFKAPLSIQMESTSEQDFLETVALLIDTRYSEIKILESLKNIEVSIYCLDNKIGVCTKTAIITTLNLNEELAYELRGALTYLKNENEIDIGIVVTQSNTETEIQQILTDRGISVITFNNLIHNLYDFKNALVAFRNIYSHKELSKKDLFIIPNGTLEGGQYIEDVEEYIGSWLNSKDSVHLTILGDFGIGKTTLCEKLTYNLCGELLDSSCQIENKRIPVLISLKNISSTNSIKSLITDIFVNELKVDISFKAFEKLNKEGRFLIILDGFDEIIDLHTESSVLKAFQEIDKLVEPRGKIILTCRTHFFKCNADIFELQMESKLYDTIKNKFGYSILFQNDFNSEQIENYLKKWAGTDYKYYLDIINSIYNLRDLATRPVLLNLIVKTIPQLSKEADSIINSSTLYKIYIRFWLERDDWRTKVIVSDRKLLAEDLANHMFLNNTSTVHYSDLPKVIKFENSEKYNEETLDYELRTCNFLNRTQDGYYKFVHKSFLEYILADNFAEILLQSNRFNIKWYLPVESDQISNRDKISASKETQDFFLQIIENDLIKMSSEELHQISFENKRKQNIIFNTIILLKNKNFGRFFTMILINNKWKLDLKVLVQNIMNSNNFEECINLIKSQISEFSDLPYFQKVVDNFILINPNNNKVKQLNNTIKKIKKSLKLDKTEYKSTSSKDYPYSREKLNISLNAKLTDIIDPSEISKIRSDFIRKWKRDKAEYDQKTNIYQRSKRKDKEKDFDKYFK